MPATAQTPKPGDLCVNHRQDSHSLGSPASDTELQTVATWLMQKPNLAALIGGAVHDAILYVLDGPRTGRFDLTSREVESDERRSVGVKLQYHVIEALGLEKLRHPDTEIDGVPIDIKATVGSNWSIPREAQCELCLLIKMDTRLDRHISWVMRTHRAWLHGGEGNGDNKRGIQIDALNTYAIQLYDWAQYPTSPLKHLTPAQHAVVFGKQGQVKRLAALFSYLPNTVISRQTILTVCFNRDDPLRRQREMREALVVQGLDLLCGKWVDQRARAATLGFDLGDSAWVAVPTTPTSHP